MLGADGTLNIPDPVFLMALYNEDIREQRRSLYNWQVEFHKSFARQYNGAVIRHAVRANNGSGKSQYVIAPAAAWMGVKFKRSRSVVTSASGSQLDRQVGQSLDHICGQINKLHGTKLWDMKYRFYRFLPTDSTVELFATDEPGLAEGYHPHLGGKEFAFFCDEAKSIPEPIYQAIERCNGMTRRTDVSSPGGPNGHFFDVCHDISGRWKQQVVTYRDCPHISNDEVEEAKSRFGANSPWFRSAYLAEFSSTEEMTVISFDTLKNHMRSQPKEQIFGEKFAGCDVAAGGDENVLSVWHGNKEIALEIFRMDDTTRTAEHLRYLIRDKHKIPPENVNVDDGNVGKSICDMLHRWDIPVNRVLNQSRALNTKIYANRGAEMWFNMAQCMTDLIFIDDKPAMEQMSNRYYKVQTTSGKIILEDKRTAKIQGHPSPDRADARVLAFAFKPAPYLQNALVDAKSINNPVRGGLPTGAELLEYMHERTYGRPNERFSTTNPQGHVYLYDNLLSGNA